jgi:hypothetical protein
MIIYRIEFTDSMDGHCIEWAGSLAAARKTRARIKREEITECKKMAAKHSYLKNYKEHFTLDMDSFIIDRMVFPNTKRGAITWLNAHLTRDNG